MPTVIDLSVLESVGPMIWRASWQASVLAVGVFAAVTMFRRQIAPAWKFGLWALVFVRLLLPWAPSVRWSPFNLAEPSTPPMRFATPQVTTVSSTPAEHVTKSTPDTTRLLPTARRPMETSEEVSRVRTIAMENTRKQDPWGVFSAIVPLAFHVWLLGVILMLGWTGLRFAGLRRAMRHCGGFQRPILISRAQLDNGFVRYRDRLLLGRNARVSRSQ